MREILPSQLPLVAPAFEHLHTLELVEMGRILDEIPEAARYVHEDLVRGVAHPGKGRPGMSAEQVLRIALTKQMTRFSYEQLAFHLGDSMSYRAFCKFGIGDRPPSDSTLKRNAKRLRPETLEKINYLLIEHAKSTGVEKGRTVRVDCTVVESNIHEPSDSKLLWDCVRVLARGMVRARDEQWVDVMFCDHRLRAKRRMVGIQYGKKKKDRRNRYLDLLKVTKATVASAQQVATALRDSEVPDLLEYARAMALAKELEDFIGLSLRVVDQTERRVLREEKVPAKEKLVSIFEPHTDIIVKDRRATYFGHKICLTTGTSGLVLDCTIEDGNPADSTLAVESVERQGDIFDRVPRQVAFDGGFASKANLAGLKELGVKDVMFHKKRGLEIADMTKSAYVFKKLRNFRAGIEAGISWLKRSFGLGRCTWRSLPSFKAYTWASLLSANLLMLARHALA